MADPNQTQSSSQPPRRFAIRFTRNLVLYYKKPSRSAKNRRYERTYRCYDLYQRIKQKAYNKPRFFVELAALVVVSFYTLFTGIQTWKIRQSTNAATESADAAVATSRAWIVPAENPPQTNRLTVVLNWINAGKTPAVKLHATAEYPSNLGSMTWGCDHLKKTNWDNRMPFLLPGTDKKFEFTLNELPAAWTQGDPHSSQILNIHGCIWYTDVLTSRERDTEFCYQAWKQGASTASIVALPCLVSHDPLIFR
jgi:hypothetical protein